MQPPPTRSRHTAMLMTQVADGRVQEYPIEGRITLGRHPSNTLRLSDREVSKEHATIEQAGTLFTVRDLDSSNGTFVNGRRVRELTLKDGDEIMLGGSRMVFRAPDERAIPTARGVTVVAAAASMPAFLAHLSQEAEEKGEFRPADQIGDLGALRQDYEKLRIAHEFQRQVGLERDRKSLFEKILKVAFELLAADNGVIFVPDEQQALIPVAVRRRTGDEAEVVLSDTVLKKVIETRQAVLTADAIIDARFSSSESIVAQGIRSAMAVPLISGGALKGVLFVDSRQRANAFSEKDLKILSGIASQAAVAIENAELAKKIEEEAVARAELSRFLSPKVAEMVVKGQVELLRAGRLAEVTVLFADIRSFTTMAETDDPQATVSMLNTFFSAMAEVIFRHEGNLDKFIGDCVMAVWGPPSAHPDDPLRAIRAALEMQEAVERINERRTNDGLKPLSVGIGVNTGQAVVGYMGSSERHEYTAIGDSVNTASRLCGVAKGGEVIASEDTMNRCGDGFEAIALPVSQVKGKEKGVRAFRVIGVEHTATGDE